MAAEEHDLFVPLVKLEDVKGEEAVLQCGVCLKQFKRAAMLEKHQRVAHITLICDQCPKTFSSKGGLAQHRKSVHLGERSHGCETCGKTFISKQALTHHVRIHTGEKPCICDSCGKAFSDPSALIGHKKNQHATVNNTVLILPCHLCGKAFKGEKAKGNLQRHLDTNSCNAPPTVYSNDFITEALGLVEKIGKHQACQQLKVPYSTLRAWVIKSSAKAEDLALACDVCDKRFSFIQHLERHKKAVHSDKVRNHSAFKFDENFRHQAVQFALETSNPAASEKFDVPESTLRRWIKVVKSPEICSICGNSNNASKSELARHMMQVHKMGQDEVLHYTRPQPVIPLREPENYFQPSNIPHHLGDHNMNLSTAGSLIYPPSLTNIQPPPIATTPAPLSAPSAPPASSLTSSSVSISNPRQEAVMLGAAAALGIALITCAQQAGTSDRSSVKNSAKASNENSSKPSLPWNDEVDNEELDFVGNGMDFDDTSYDIKEEDRLSVKEEVESDDNGFDLDSLYQFENVKYETENQNNEQWYKPEPVSDEDPEGFKELKDLNLKIKQKKKPLVDSEGVKEECDESKVKVKRKYRKKTDNENPTTAEGRFQCTECYSTFREEKNLRRHLIKHTEGRKWECPTCQKTFFFQGDLRRHQLSHTGEKNFQCNICAKVFGMRCTLIRHEKTHDEENKPKEKNRRHDHSVPREHVCTTCGKAYLTTATLKEHERTHTEEFPYKCGSPGCGAKFKSRREVADHQVADHDNPLPFGPCQECGRFFRRSHELETHVNKHLGVKPHKCDICSGGYISKEMLRKHRLLVHNMIEDREVLPDKECTECGKKFHFAAKLEQHMNGHFGIKNFHCDQCEKSYSSNSELRKHCRLTHVSPGELPYGCDVCGKCFGRLSTLQTHMLIHTGKPDRQCQICGKSYKEKRSLKNHIATSHGIGQVI